MKTILSEAIKCNQEEKHLAVTLEFARWELADAEKELKLLKSSVSSSEKEYDQIQKDTEAIEMELESERYFFFSRRLIIHQVWIRDRFSKKVFTLQQLADTISILIMIL